jgi:5-hydroxyisourate hydrolase-like protein (transthyretin family)
MTSLKLRSWAIAGVLAASTLRCGGETPPTDPGTATKIAMAGGDGQTGLVGQALAQPLIVVVTDASGDPVEGVSVQWDAQGAGSVSSDEVTTDANGRASVTRVLGAAAGAETTTATVSGLQGSPVTFGSTAVEAAASSIVITTNPPATALSGEVFDPAKQPVVIVTDDGGNPAASVEVTASKASGSGTLEGTTTATTDAAGVAQFGDLGISGTGSHTLEFTSGTNSVTSPAIDILPLPSEATSGKWGPLVPWDIVPLHMSLLPTGKILAWGKTDAAADTMGMPRVWDPSSGAPDGATMINVDTMLFCAGHALMPNGTLMVAGGHSADGVGLAVTNFFDQNGVWSKGPNMAHARWYPTITTLPDGRMLTMGGTDQTATVVKIPEIWENGAWVELPGASQTNIPYYPRNFVAPNGRIFYAGERIRSLWFDVDGTGAGGGRGAWSGTTSASLDHIWKFNRDYGTAVMYEPGKILYAGGGGNLGWGQTPDPKAGQPTETAEKIDLNQSNPTWQSAASMSVARRHLNSTILPDGKVLITGGTSGGGFVNIDPGLATRAAELWNPSNGQWTTLASNSKMRVYHSVSLLLPDGTVLHGASGDALAVQPGGGVVPVPSERNHEIFSPPYLFKGARPTITSAPTSVSVGGTITVTTPNAAQITDVRWIRLGSVTHAFDAGQRANTLAFTKTATGVDVVAPANHNLAPPGFYLLFILNRNGVPSVGTIIRFP